MSKHFSRREFLQVSSVTAAAGAAALSPWSPSAPSVGTRRRFPGKLCLFSKAVPQLSWSELAKGAKQSGFEGVDLTVRSEGHVLPLRATSDLPKAVEAIREEGLEVPMITTELVKSDDPTANAILQTAKTLSIPFIKAGYYHYKLVNVREELEDAGRQFRGLVELAGRYGIQVGYHNHSHYIGAPIWDMARVMETLDPRWCGFYFDLGHATTDGAESGWEIATNLVMPRLKMLAVKDFVWTQLGPHKWQIETCPMGRGMVRWGEFLHILAQSKFDGPISLHQEFAIPGVADNQGIAISREAVPKVMAAAKENLDYLKSLLREAYGEA